jgi:hypothetical protein
MGASKCGLSLLFLALAIFTNAQDRYMVFFKDKAGSPYSLSNPEGFLSTKSINRRSKQAIDLISEDLPVNPSYKNAVAATGAKVMYATRWFNGVLVEATSAQRNSIAALASVSKVEFAAPGKTGTGGRISAHSKFEDASAGLASDAQNSMLGLGEMHSDGYKGEEITIAVFDTGFPGVNVNPAFQDIIQSGRIRDSYNFSYGHANAFMSHPHGARVFSIIAATLTDFRGGAYGANFLLYATEFDPTEYKVEEYNWLFAAERADSAGADIISSSLGYTDFDDPTMDYSTADLNGETAVISKAASKAVARGMMVVSSAGNYGNTAWQLISPPADAEHVLTVGSVDANLQRSSFSSLGPTADGRIKPDVVALGTANMYVDPGGALGSGNGTSYSCPLITSLVAGVWQQWPELTALQMVELIRKAGTQYFRPDNFLGYGVPTYRAFKNIKDFSTTTDGVYFYPNPVTTDELNMLLAPADGSDVDVTISNVMGEVIQAFTFEAIWDLNPAPINLKGLQPGLYLATVSFGNKKKSFRIIKQ